jgi:hypothetical protein
MAKRFTLEILMDLGKLLELTPINLWEPEAILVF